MPGCMGLVPDDKDLGFPIGKGYSILVG